MPAGASEEMGNSSKTYTEAARIIEAIPPSSTPLWQHRNPPWTSKRRHGHAPQATLSPDYEHGLEEKQAATMHPRMAAAALQARCQRDQHPKDPRLAERQRHEHADEGAHNSKNSLSASKATTWHKDLFIKIITTKETTTILQLQRLRRGSLSSLGAGLPRLGFPLLP